MEEQEAINANLQEYKSYLYGKLARKEAFSITECQYLAYFESWESRGDSDHGKGKDPLVGAVVEFSPAEIYQTALFSAHWNHASMMLGVKKGPPAQAYWPGAQSKNSI